MEENENFAYTYTQKIISQVVPDVDKETIKTITRYCEENDIYPNLISEERIKEIIELGLKSEQLQQELSKANDKLKKIKEYIYGHKLFGMRYGKTLYRESLINILSIIKGGKE